MCSAHTLDTMNVPTRFTDRTRSNSCGVTLSRGPAPKPAPEPPATLATSSIGPSASMASATACADLVLVGDIGPDRDGLRTRGAQVVDERVEVVRGGEPVAGKIGIGPGDVESRDLGALGRQPHRGGAPDGPGTGCARDEYDLACDSVQHAAGL